MSDKKLSQTSAEPAAQGAIIDEHGREVPITDDMIQEALDDIKPQSIGWKTGMMEAITDDMLKDKPEE